MEDIAVFQTSNSTDYINSAINHGPASIIITRSTSSLSSFSSLSNSVFLSNSSLSSFSASIQLDLSFLLLEPSRSCHARPMLFSKFLGLVNSAGLSAIAEDYFGAPAIGSFFDSNSLLFSSSGTDDSVVLRNSFS